MRRAFIAAAVAAVLTLPAGAGADPIVTNPFGNLRMTVVSQPNGATAGLARLEIVTAAGAAFRHAGDRIFFGLRVMGSEDLELAGFRLTGDDGCIVSDFAGNNTPGGWQGSALFGTQVPGAGSLNSHMRMIGGFIKKSCGNIQIDVAYRARPLVAYYAAFFGYRPAPWHQNYDEAPWSVAPAGGNSAYEHWWNLWGSFDTLGYSNACTNLGGTAVTCG